MNISRKIWRCNFSRRLFPCLGLTAFLSLLISPNVVAESVPVPATVSLSHSSAAQAHGWLDKMSRSSRQLNYQGVFTYERGEQMFSLQIFHAVKDGMEKERLVYLSGKQREIFRDAHALNCIHPGSEAIRLQSSNPLRNSHLGPATGQQFADKHREFDEYYQLLMDGEDRIADRRVVKINVKPKDAYRYGHLLYIDKQTGLLLKSMVLDAKGRALERFQFASVSIGQPIMDEDLSVQSKAYHMANHGGAEHDAVPVSAGADPSEDIAAQKSMGQSLSQSQWRVNWVPKGYVKARKDMPHAGGIVGSNGTVKKLESNMFTDGLSAFSVFLELAQASSVIEGVVQRGATVAFTRRLMMEGINYIVTVVGEVPAATAEKVASSVRQIK